MNQEKTAPELRSKLVSADDLAASFNPPVSRSTVYLWRGQDLIRPARKDGRVLLYDLELCLAAIAKHKAKGRAERRPIQSRGNSFEPLYAGEVEVSKLDEPVRPENVIAQNFPDTFREIAPTIAATPVPAPQPAAPVATKKSVEAGIPAPAPRERDHSTNFLALLARRARVHQEKGEVEAENALLWALVEAGGFGGAV
jgi:hypothetical protein